MITEYMPMLTMLALAFIQNVSFTLVSRSRNRNNFWYHMIASVGSNTIWFLTFRQLILADMTWGLLVPYTLGTVSGSLSGQYISIMIEKAIGAKADERPKFEELEVVTDIRYDSISGVTSVSRKKIKVPLK